MEFKGRIIAILEAQHGTAKASGKEWKKQEYVIEETSGQYPKKMCFTVFGEDKITDFNIQEGEELTVHINIDANQWQDRWFNSINAWKIIREQPQQQQPQQAPAQAPPAPTSDGSDLPFQPTKNKKQNPIVITTVGFLIYVKLIMIMEKASCFTTKGFRNNLIKWSKAQIQAIDM